MFIKHDRHMDVCIEVRSISLNKEGVKVYGSFWNLGQDGVSYPIGEDVRINIVYDNIPNWKQCIDSNMDLRTATWEVIKL